MEYCLRMAQGLYMGLNDYIKMEERSKINHLNLNFKKLDKKE